MSVAVRAYTLGLHACETGHSKAAAADFLSGEAALRKVSDAMKTYKAVAPASG
jgi:hypothetical protein